MNNTEMNKKSQFARPNNDSTDRSIGLMSSVDDTLNQVDLLNQAINRLEEKLQVFLSSDSAVDQAADDVMSAPGEPPAVTAVRKIYFRIQSIRIRVDELADRVYP